MIGALVVRRMWKDKMEQAFNTRDVDALMEAVAQDAVFEFGGTSGLSGRYEGKAEIRRFFARAFARYLAIHCRIGRVALARPYAFGASNTVMSEMHFEISTDEGTLAVVDLVNVSELRHGKVVRARDYLFDETPEIVMWGRKAGDRAA